MRIRMMCLAATFLILAGAGVAQQTSAGAQQDSEKSVAAHSRADDLAAPKRYYKLDFVLRETDDGKPVNQRTFAMNIAADKPEGEKPTWWNLRSGTRVPLVDGKGGINWVEVGVNLDLRAFDQPNGLQLEITSEISSAATETGNTAPPIRQVKVRSAVLAPVGKPTTVFTADDPASKHQFELQVTPILQR